MGEAKRRKRLDPNYGETTVRHFVKDGLDIFPEQILVDYFDFLLGWRVPSDKESQSVLRRMFDVYEWNEDKLICYIDSLNIESQAEFSRFMYYICTRGALIVVALEMANKRKIVEEDIFPLWQPLLLASLYKKGRLTLRQPLEAC